MFNVPIAFGVFTQGTIRAKLSHLQRNQLLYITCLGRGPNGFLDPFILVQVGLVDHVKCIVNHLTKLENTNKSQNRQKVDSNRLVESCSKAYRRGIMFRSLFFLGKHMYSYGS